MGSNLRPALDDEMRLDLPAVEAFLDRHRGRRILLFGFTYMVWKHFCLALEELGRTLPIQGGVLIHGGGWKKLAGQAVSPEEFRARLGELTEEEREYARNDLRAALSYLTETNELLRRLEDSLRATGLTEGGEGE